MTQTLYDLLGCGNNCTNEQILAEYRVRVVEVHPDKVNKDQKADAEKKFHELQKAKEILCDDVKRKHYDLYLSMGAPLGILLDEWMQNQEELQQTLHWAQPSETVQMIQDGTESLSSCKTKSSPVNYPRRYNGWISHTSPIINAFRNYKI